MLIPLDLFHLLNSLMISIHKLFTQTLASRTFPFHRLQVSLKHLRDILQHQRMN